MVKSDLISRKALLKDLREELKECRKDADEFGGENVLWAEGIEFAIDAVKQTKAVDAVEVVRCKDCKHFKPAHFKADDGTETPWDETFNWDDRSDGIYHGGKCKHDRNTAYGQKDMAFRKPDDFCSYGERKGDWNGI